MNASAILRLLAVAVLCPVTAFAQSDVLDEIVVTADFRGRTISKMPVSVSVLDAEAIANTATQHFEEIINFIPNLNWSGDGHRARYLQIRGVGELEQYQGAPNPSIGFLIDDIDLSGIGTVATLFDIESIEILRGPQGSRYGANALGGLVYIRSAAPTADRNGRVQLTAGDDDALSIGAAIGGPASDDGSVLFRVSAHRHESNGFRNNNYLDRKDTNGRDETTLRGRITITPSDLFEANVALLYVNVDNGYDAFALDNGYTMLSDKPGKDAQETLGMSLRLDWESVGPGSLTSITSFASSDIDFSFDADWGNDGSWAPVLYDYISLSSRKRKTLNQEFRLETDSWLFGLYALHLSDDLATLNQGDYYDPFYDWADSLDYPFNSNYESTNLAGFAQFHRDLSDSTRMSAGLRIERRTSDYSDTDGLEDGPSDTLWGGELSLSHDFNTAITGYTTLSRGYKAGGFNLGPVPDNWRRFDAEAMWTLEAGIKSALADNTVLLNAAVFHSWRKDQQVRASFQLVPNDPASFGFATINIDGATGWGAETDLRWLPSEEFEVYASIGLLYGKFPGQITEFPWLQDREQAHSPNYTLAAGAAYNHPSGVFARFDMTAKDEFYFDVSHNQKSSAYELLNARVGYENEDWLIYGWVRNLSDKYYAVRGFYFGNEPPDFPATLYTRGGDPRQYGVTIERRF